MAWDGGTCRHPKLRFLSPFVDSPVTINGVVYLLPLSAFHSDDSVFSFDLESEEWKNVIRGPLKKTRC
jgi:hypothetical protein